MVKTGERRARPGSPVLAGVLDVSRNPPLVAEKIRYGGDAIAVRLLRRFLRVEAPWQKGWPSKIAKPSYRGALLDWRRRAFKTREGS